MDLLAGELKGVSEPIDWLGQPWHLAYDPVHSRLYIASMHKMWSSMWPVTALWARGGEFEVVNRFPTNRENDLLEKARAGEMPPNVPIHEAYGVVVSPNGKTLFVSHAGLAEKEASTAVWNYQTGELKRLLSTPLQSHYSWSPDGNRMASIWPSHEREKQENGSTMTEILPGGVVEQGYVLLIDVMDRREITRTPVGARCTNVVVAYEEIEQGA